MHDTIAHWQNCAARYSLRALPGAIVFAKYNKDDPASGKAHNNDDQRDPRDLINDN